MEGHEVLMEEEELENIIRNQMNTVSHQSLANTQLPYDQFHQAVKQNSSINEDYD